MSIPVPIIIKRIQGKIFGEIPPNAIPILSLKHYGNNGQPVWENSENDDIAEVGSIVLQDNIITLSLSEDMIETLGQCVSFRFGLKVGNNIYFSAEKSITEAGLIPAGGTSLNIAAKADTATVNDAEVITLVTSCAAGVPFKNNATVRLEYKAKNSNNTYDVAGTVENGTAWASVSGLAAAEYIVKMRVIQGYTTFRTNELEVDLS